MILPGGVSSVIFELTGETAGKETADWLVSKYRRHNLRDQTPPISPSCGLTLAPPRNPCSRKPFYPLAHDRIRWPRAIEIRRIDMVG